MDIQRVQRSAGNQSINRLLQLGQSRGEQQELVVITDEQESAECTEFYLRDPARSDSRTGTLVHAALRNWLKERGPGDPVIPGLVFPTGSKAALYNKSFLLGGPGYPDLAYQSTQLQTIELAEIKPANPEGFTDGQQDIQWYLDKGNEDIGLKLRLGISVFRPMEPWKFELPRILLVESRKFKVMWCTPGVILYKEVGGKKKERDRKAKEPSELKSSRQEPERQTTSENLISQSQLDIPLWAPAELRDAILITANNPNANEAIPEGFDGTSWTYVWPGGFSTPLLVNRIGRAVEMQALWPQDRQFYDLYAEKVGEDETFAQRLHAICTEWNADLLSLLDASRREQYRYASIQDARDRLRAINDKIARAFLEGLVGAFAGSGLVGAAPSQITSRSFASSRMTARASMKAANTFDELMEIIEEVFRRKGARQRLPVPVP